MRFTIFTAPAQGVELEAKGYSVTAEGALLVTGDSGTIVTWAPGAWRSILDNEAFKAAYKAGNADENPGRRQATRPIQAI